MKTLMRSDELSCPSCVAKIEKRLGRLEGVHSATVSFNTGRIEVEHRDDVPSSDELVQAVRDAGYEARVVSM